MSSSGGGAGGFGDEDDMRDEDKPKLKRGKDGVKRWDNRKYEWDCPECSANNPVDDGFLDQDEISCNYCGNEYRVTFIESGKLKFRAI